MVPERRHQRTHPTSSINELGTLTGPRSLFLARYRGPHPPTHQEGVEALCLNVPLLDPTCDFSGPRAPGSFFPVKDVWVPYYWFLRQTSRITCLNGFNDRGTPAGREPDIKNVHHIDGSKPFLEACEQAFLFGFPRLFSSPPWTTVLRSANHLH